MRSIKTTRVAQTVLLALLLTLSSSCSLYNESFRSKEAQAHAQHEAEEQARAQAETRPPNYTLEYIEADDRGAFRDPSLANKALEDVKASKWLPQSAEASGSLWALDEGIFKPT